ncbi:MAG: hypothetical protein ACHBN1_36575, partial [Heteroscytonema crispum UTEX LB 1556]
LRPLARPQDRSGSPTKGAKLTGGNLPDCRLSAVSPPTARLLQLALPLGCWLLVVSWLLVVLLIITN